MKAEPEGSTLATVSSVTNGPSTLGERVRSARRAAGLSQAQLAGDELTKGFISQVEAGLVRPSIRSLQVIAGRLGRSLDYFVGDESLTAAKRATFHRLAADAAAERSDWQASETQARAGLASTTDPAERGRFFRLLGAAALYQGRREEAFDHVAAGLALLDPAKHAFDVARLLYLRASAYAETGQLVAATEAYEAVRDVIERYEVVDPRLRSRVFVALGTAYRRLGRTTKAIAAYESALAVASRGNELKLAAQGYVGIAVSYYDSGELDSAIVNYERALDLFERISDTGFELGVRQSLAAIHLDQGHVAQAKEIAERTLVRAAEVGDDHWAAVAQAVEARALLSEGRLDEARELAAVAERKLAAAGDPIQRAHALRVLGGVSEQAGDHAGADRRYRESIELLAGLEDRADLATIAVEYAKLLRTRGDIDGAFEMLELARSRR